MKMEKTNHWRSVLKLLLLLVPKKEGMPSLKVDNG